MRRLALVLLLPLSVAACAQPASIEMTDVWTRDTIGRTANAAVFMTIRAPSADRLLGASTPVAARSDLMTMEGGGNAMAMAYVKAIDIPANAPVSLDPSGLHVWLAGLHQPLKAGQTFPLTLRFEKAGERQVEVAVIAPAAPPPKSAGTK